MSEWRKTDIGSVSKSLQEYKISEVVDCVIDNRGKTPPSSEKGYKLVETNQVSRERLFPIYGDSQQKYVSKETYKNWFRSGHPTSEDILFTTVGERVPQFCLVDNQEICIAQNLIALRIKKNIADPLYLLNYFRLVRFIKQVENILLTTAQPSVKVPHLLNLDIYLPSKENQIKISNLLFNIDRKIENLRKQNETLEAIAQTLFKHWFVDFEFPNEDGKPYKSSGGAMERSELGEIPAGWRVEALDKVANFLNGLALQNYPAKSDDFLPVIKIREMKSGLTANTEKASPEIPNQYVIDNGDVIFSWSGSLEIIIWCFGKGALNQHLFKVYSEKYPKWFYYFWNLEHLKNFRAIAKSKATTMGHIQRKHLSEALCCVPDENRLQIMNFTVSPILEKTIQNNLQIQTLTKTRDRLLPQLMSGKLRISE